MNKPSALEQVVSLIKGGYDHLPDHQRSALDSFQKVVHGYLSQVDANKQQPFFNSTDNTPMQWLGKVVEDTRKRGPFEGVQDLSYPILENPYIEPIEEPIVGQMRTMNYKAGRPSTLVNNLLGQTDAIYQGKPFDWSKPFSK